MDIGKIAEEEVDVDVEGVAVVIVEEDGVISDVVDDITDIPDVVAKVVVGIIIVGIVVIVVAGVIGVMAVVVARAGTPVVVNVIGIPVVVASGADADHTTVGGYVYPP